MDNMDFAGNGTVFAIGAVMGCLLAAALSAVRPVREVVAVLAAGWLLLVLGDDGLAGLLHLGRQMLGQMLEHRTLIAGVAAGLLGAGAVLRRRAASARR